MSLHLCEGSSKDDILESQGGFGECKDPMGRRYFRRRPTKRHLD